MCDGLPNIIESAGRAVSTLNVLVLQDGAAHLPGGYRDLGRIQTILSLNERGFSCRRMYSNALKRS